MARSLWLLMTGRNRALVTAAELTASLRSAYRSMEVATQRMEIVIEASPFGILIVNAEGRIQMANPTAERIFGYSKDELITLPVEQLVPAAARDGHHSKMDNYRAAPTPRRMGANRRLSACRQDGSEIPVEVGLTPLRVGDEGTVLVTVLDISERARAEDELAHHRHQLEDLVRERTADAVRAKEAAERANAAKSVFLTNMSDELRTPLCAVLSFARLGQNRAAEAGVPPKLAQYFDRICEGA